MLEFAEANHIDRETLFVEVILPLAIAKNYTYRVPFEWNGQVAIGKRVVVQFGKSKLYTAVIVAVGNHPPEKYEAKYIIEILDSSPLVTERPVAVLELDGRLLHVLPGRSDECRPPIGPKAGQRNQDHP